MARSKEQVTVALAVEANRWIREEAVARGWRLASLLYGGYGTVSGLDASGALVSFPPDHELVRELREQGCSLVRVGKLPHPDDASLPAVLPDVATQGQLAAEHFFERGFRDVGYAGSDPWSDAKALFDAFHERSEQLGMTSYLHRFRATRARDGNFAHDQKHNDFIKWIEETPKPLGLLVAGDPRAATQCSWTIEAGFSVPDDVAILSTCTFPNVCENMIPSISSIDPNEEERMRTACDLLAQMMEGKKAPTKPVMISPAGIVERESTNVLATSDRKVAEALRYMWEHFDLSLSVEDVASEIGMSSRQLARHFRQALGRTVTEELRHKRLEEAKRLLRSTKLPLVELAPLVGFKSTSYLHRSFQKAFGTTPAQYRRIRR